MAKQFKFDVEKYNFEDLGNLVNYIKKVWIKYLRLENKMTEDSWMRWTLNDLYFQGVNFTKSNNEQICVKFLIHDWNSPYEQEMLIPMEAFTNFKKFEEKKLEEYRILKEAEAEKARKKEERRLKREAKKKEEAEREELLRLKEKYEN